MSDQTSLDEKKAEVQSLLENLKSAVNQPRLYVFQFFEDLKNDIDIQSCKTLNETNKERVYEHQAKLINKVQEFESLCLEQINEESACDVQVTIEQIEADLNGAAEAELDRINGLLSNELLKIEKVLFQDKCMLFVKAGENDDESSYYGNKTDNLEFISEILQKKYLYGLLITVEDCFLRKGVFNKK